MGDFRSGRSFRMGGYHGTLRTGALIVMVTGVVLLALAAFLLSYAGLHEIATAVGFPRGLAALYPLILDAIVVLACVAALTFRGAERWLQAYAWLLIVVVFAALAAINAIHAAHVSLPQRPTAAAAAIVPWVLLLLGFGLLLSLLRQRRADRQTTALGDLGKRNTAVRRAVGRESTDKTFPAVEHFPWDAGPDTSDVRLTMPHVKPDTQDAEPETSIPRPSAAHSPAAAPDSPDAWPDGPDVRIIPARSAAHSPAAAPDSPDAWPDGPDVRIIPARSAAHSPAAAPDTSAAAPDSPDAWPDGPDVRIIPARSAAHSPAAAPDTSAAAPDSPDAWPDGPDRGDFPGATVDGVRASG